MAARRSRVPAPVGATSPSVGPWGSARSNNSSGSYLTNWTMSLFGLGSLGSCCIEYKSNTQKNLHLSFLLLQCLRKHLITQAQDHTWLRGHPVQKLNASAELARTQQPFLHIICTEQPPDSLSRGHFGELSQRHTAGTKKQLSLLMNGKKELCTNSLSCPEYLVIPRQPRTPSALGLCRDRCPYHTSGPWQHTEHSKRSNRNAWYWSLHPNNTAGLILPIPADRIAGLFQTHPTFLPTTLCCSACEGERRFTRSKCRFEGKISCKDKKLHLQKLRRSALKNQTPKYMWTHENSGQTST